MACPYTTSQIPPKAKETGVAWSCESDGLLNVGHPGTQGAREPQLCKVLPLGDIVGQVSFRSSSLELSLERFDSGFRLFGPGIINEVLLARHPQASTIHIIWTSSFSLSCSLPSLTHRRLHCSSCLPAPLTNCSLVTTSIPPFCTAVLNAFRLGFS
jgi:hypothetical protein